jgi:hypothetical protein
MFLSRHGFSLDEVYDGRGKSKTRREYQAKQAGKVLILTSTRCRAMGHGIRTRGGHCAQCNPACIEFTARETATGYVYIAGSLRGRFIKVGVAGDVWQRERQLKAERYGGVSDWVILIHRRVGNMQKIEREISSRIPGKRINNDYFKDGREKMSMEVIQCSFSTALDAYAEITTLVEDKQYWLDRWSRYDFTV